MSCLWFFCPIAYHLQNSHIYWYTIIHSANKVSAYNKVKNILLFVKDIEQNYIFTGPNTENSYNTIK
jgi:hypothetical protein